MLIVLDKQRLIIYSFFRVDFFCCNCIPRMFYCSVLWHILGGCKLEYP